MASILVIDDDDAVLTTIKILLERQSHDVAVASTGKKGLQLLQAQSFDLTIVDIFMPDLDGFETMSRIHLLRPAIPIIVISGYEFQVTSSSPPDFLRIATQLGAVASVRKPFRPSDLLAAVTQCLAARNDRAGD
ncbi:MAG: response regulator [Rhizobiales bacterium]|nr:response regulator [Hyphomicrobiales bacterium]